MRANMVTLPDTSAIQHWPNPQAAYPLYGPARKLNIINTWEELIEAYEYGNYAINMYTYKIAMVSVHYDGKV